jgi:23S rRNA (guanosine2251-2'-O)-methyltransferase
MKLTTEELFIRHAKADTPSLLSNSIICLHNIRSAYNVGAVFRNADAFGIQQVFLSGFTPTPETNIEVSKTAIGAEKQVPWSYFTLWSTCNEKLQKSESQIFAVEQT